MKKKLPLELIKGFRPEENPYYYLVRHIAGNNFLVKFIDNDVESDFFFQIEKINPKNQFLIVYKPYNSRNVDVLSSWFSIEEVNSRFKEWLNTIYEYNNTETILDDPITKGFANQFFNEWKFTDPDADCVPFKYNHILLLEEHLKRIENGIIQYKNADNAEIIDEIIEDAKELQIELVKKTKNEILKKLAIIWAKMVKNGVPLVKEFVKEGFKEGMRIGIKTILE